jgi:thioredoxin reductase (NADPH)
MYFANYARSVTILIRGESLAKTMSHYLIEQLATKSNVAVESRTVVANVDGQDHLETITTRRVDTGVETPRAADALFVFIGADTETAWLPDPLERDARGFIRTGRDIETWTETRPPFALETSVPGIFAAGDVRAASVKRVASSVGEGSMAIAYIHEYLALRAQATLTR